MTTIEERLESLTETVEIIAGQLNGRGGNPSPRTEGTPAANKPRATFSTNVADYDFSQTESRFNSPVEKILEVVNGSQNPGGSKYVTMTVPLGNGKQKLAKALWRGGNPSTASERHIVKLSKSLTDYDFSDFNSRVTNKVVRIVDLETPQAILDSQGLALAALTVELQNGKTLAVRVPIARDHKLEKLSTSMPRPAAIRPTADDSEDVTIAYASVNLNRLQSAGTANQQFYTELYNRGKAHCAAKVKPLLAATPYPAGAANGVKIAHVRMLIAKHLAPTMAEAIPAVVVAEPGTLEAWKANADLRNEFPSFANYRAYHRLAGDKVTQHRLRMEDELEKKGPQRVDGKWRLPTIGAYEQEWLDSPQLQAEFPTPDNYAAYRRRMG